MIEGRLRSLSTALYLFFTVLAASIQSWAATPYTGFYNGVIYITISGNISFPEHSAGAIAFTIKEDGSIVSSGDLVGTVDNSGAITWVTPNSLYFTTGRVDNGVISSTGSSTTDGTTTTFRVSASNAAPGFSGTSPLSGRIERINPKEALSRMTRIRFANNRFMAVGERGAAAFSEDGLNWTPFGVTTTLPLFDIAYGNGMYVIVGDSGVVFTSPDGVTWTARSTGVYGFTSVAFGNGIFMRCNFLGQTQTSTDGIVWQTSTVQVPGGGSYAGLDFVNGQFALYNGSITFTTDGSAEAVTGSPGIGNIGISLAAGGRVTFGNGVYVAGGSTGVAYSDTGAVWTKAAGPTTRVDAMGFGNGLFVAIDAAKTVWISPDGAQWEPTARLPVGTASLVYANGKFFTVGGEMHTSVDGRTWIMPGKDAVRPDVTAVYFELDRGTPRTTIYHERFTSTLPSAGPDEPGSILGIYMPKSTDISRLWVGADGYIFYYGGETNFIQRANGVGPKLTDKTLRAFATFQDSVVIGGDAGTMIRVTRPNSLIGPDFALMTPVTTANLLSGAGSVLVGTGGTIIRSANGRDWTSVNSGTTENLRFVFNFGSAEGYTGGLYIAVGDHGTILTSADGTAWTQQTSGSTANLVGVGYSNSTVPPRFLAAGKDGTMLQSTNGTNWSAHAPLPVAHRLTSFRNWDRQVLGGGLNGEIIQEVGPLTNGATRAYFSQNYENTRSLASATLGNGRWVMVGNAVSGISLDGHNWSFRHQRADFTSVTFGKGKFVAAASGGIAISGDGLTWTFKTNKNVTAVTYGNGRFAAVGTSIHISDDGENWVTKPNPALSSGINAITYGDGKFVGTGGNGVSLYSLDNGDTWSVGSAGGQIQQSVAYGNGIFASVGTDGRTTYSLNGVNWTSQRLNGPSTTESRPLFYSVIYANGQFFAGTYGGALYTCTNGFDWKILNTGLNGDIFAMAAGNGLMLLGGGHEIHAVTMQDLGGPAVTEHPEDVNAVEGQDVVLSANITGSNLDLVWLKDGQPITNGGRFSGANSLELTINGILPEDAGGYSLSAGNADGSRATRIATVQVFARPQIASQPQNLVLQVGKSGVLSVTALGQGLAYQWFRNGLAIEGATSASFSFENASSASAGTYHVEVTNAAGKLASAPASVSVRSGSAALALDPTWLATPLPFGANPYLVKMAVAPDGKILISGYFTLPRPGGGVLTNLARLNADGSIDGSFNMPAPDSESDAFYFLPNGQILVGGYFGKFGSAVAKGLIRLNADGSIDNSYSPNVGPAYSGPLNFMARADGKIIAAGAFNLWGGSSIKYLGLLNSDGTPDTTFVPAVFNNVITAAAQLPDGSIVVGGNFTSPAGRLARMNSLGQLDSTFNAGASGILNLAPYQFPSVSKIVVAPDGKLYVCGAFGVYDNQNAVCLMRLNANGSLDTTFNAGIVAGAGSLGLDVALVEDKLLFGGRFTSIKGDGSRTNLAMLDATGNLTDGLDLSVSPNADVNQIVPAGGGNYYILGTFSQVDGQPRKLLAKLVAGSSEMLPRSITSQPQPITTQAGGTVTFSVAATGHGTLSFQWRHGEQDLSGQTGPTLTLQNVQATDLGLYTVVVTDANGSTSSDAAELKFSGAATGFAAWAGNLPAGQQGPLDDPDHDGISNIAEYAFGLNGLLAETDGKPKALAVQVSNQLYPAVQFTRNTAATGATIQVSASASLDFSTAETVVESAEPLGQGLERVTVRAAQPTAGTFFFRVSILAQ